jgi:hypothetical protein
VPGDEEQIGAEVVDIDRNFAERLRRVTVDDRSLRFFAISDTAARGYDVPISFWE